MHDFKYCLWLTSETTPWSNYTNGFQPHLTIKSHLSYEECLSLQKTITLDFKPLEIELLDEVKYSSTVDFESTDIYRGFRPERVLIEGHIASSKRPTRISLAVPGPVLCTNY